MTEMVPLYCLFSAFVFLYPVPSPDVAGGGIIRVRSDVTCEVNHSIVSEGLKVNHRFVTTTIPIPRDGKWHMVTYDFRSDRADVSFMMTVPVKRFIGDY